MPSVFGRRQLVWYQVFRAAGGVGEKEYSVQNPSSILYSSQLRLVHRHRLLITHHPYKCGNQSEGCNSYELYIHSATWKSRPPLWVTNNRSTRKTSLVTETVVNERTNLLTCQLKSVGVVMLAGRGKHTRLRWGSILSGVGFSEIYLWLKRQNAHS